ncbi:heptose I phosphotransferase [Rubritalea squalenifaciens DSM 18772]|uniref:Heptose I phosphotransferase n=1 Tax=Rubritalea squalenifaciens DSM 18772 TaxID=1123071 RepID=A0A1M6EJ58_9BACT|nr:lipopolysaccharide core heptose(I) kinase RfaP [Rubritalea squalenifaciens]SHI85471.1 heptose I phosphotransferase [Rubritalea squalenifaciens DSM 18772]
MIDLSPEMQRCFPEPGSFEKVLEAEGDVVRAKEGRRTFRFEFEGKGYFAKVHLGIGWGEVFKNLTQFRCPVVDASNEWKAVSLLESVGVETVSLVGKGARGANPAKRQSFVIMDELKEKVELEDFMKEYGGLTGSKRLKLKRTLVRQVADIGRRMHGAGMNHRDFYLCHFHIGERDWSTWTEDQKIRLPLLDLHRAQIRGKVPHRWLAKDLGALFYSAIDCGITDRDMVAFLRGYLGEQWKSELKKDAALWDSVVSRARGFYRKHRGKLPVLPGVFANLP